MKHTHTFLAMVFIAGLSVQKLNAQWRGKHHKFERIDTVISIPKGSQSLLSLSGEDVFVRLVLPGIDIQYESWWDYDQENWKNRKKPQNIEYFEQHDHGTLRRLNFEFGFISFLHRGRFPSSKDLYQVNPIASNFVGIRWNHVTHIDEDFYIDWGGGLTWYNYKFENAATRLETAGGLVKFVEDRTIKSAIKSKLKVTWLNFTFIPMFDFGHGKRVVRASRDEFEQIAFSKRRGFRIGLGPYLGLRLGNKAKYVFRDADGRKKVKDKGSFYLNQMHYGLRLQIGINRFDMFVNYDFSKLFEQGSGPALNPVSIGVIL